MVANPEICRMNGAKSKGAITPIGKAIASRNATKHGLLASKPPLVMGEDLETFQATLKALWDEYQPQSTTESMLLEQVAMGWLRLHRLWGVEAAIANLAMHQLELNERFPDTYSDSLFGCNDFEPATPSLTRQQLAEKELLTRQIAGYRQSIQAIPDDLDKLSRYERHIIRSLYQALGQLAAIQTQRQNQGSMGSFGCLTDEASK